MFGKKKKQVIKFEQNHCNASINDNAVLFVRVKDVINDSDAKLEVDMWHNAFMIKGGGDCRFYKSGTYPVFDNKAEVKAWKGGASVDVIYIPKETNVVIRWGTPNQVTYRDSICGKVIAVGARGEFGIEIKNPEQFLRKVVGVRTEFDLEDFSKRFATAVMDEFGDCFLHVVDDQKLSYDQFGLNRRMIGSKIGAALSEKFAQSWGIGLTDFIIEDFKISEEDKQKVEQVAEDLRREQEEMKLEAKKKEILAELERLSDKDWEREKYLRQLEQENTQAYFEVLKVIGNKESLEKSKGGSYCPSCGHSCETTADFCPNCGTRLGKTIVVCPDCKTTNNSNASFCSGCGKKLN